jgi:DNA-binding transcriptional ArsR family regulator
MIERLSEGPVSASELAKPLGVSLAAVVQHLQLLEQCSLVRSEKVGRTRLCRMEPAGLRAVEKWISDRRASWERKFDRLGDILAEDPPLPDADP